MIYKLMGGATTIRLSRETLNLLEQIRWRIGAKSLDETIRLLIRRQRKYLINQAFGIDRGRIQPFREEDRGEDRS